MDHDARQWERDERLARHRDLIDTLTRLVADDEEFRWFEVGCSLGAGRADQHSDIDAGVGYRGDGTNVEALGRRLVSNAGAIVDLLIHRMAGRDPGSIRCAVEYASGVQLDLVVMPASHSLGLPDETIAVVDKDGTLATPWTPDVAGPPSAREAREWAYLAWWALSDVAKYVSRGSLFEALDRLAAARGFVLRLVAVGSETRYPSFGLTSILDFRPGALPATLAATYCRAEATAVVDAAEATADLLTEATAEAAAALGETIDVPSAVLSRARLERASADLTRPG